MSTAGHARRKFIAAWEGGEERAQAALAWIGQLYAVAHEGRLDHNAALLVLENALLVAADGILLNGDRMPGPSAFRVGSDLEHDFRVAHPITVLPPK